MPLSPEEKLLSTLKSTHPCSCGHEVFLGDPFCCHCGQPNKHFSVQSFELQYGISLSAQIKGYCQDDDHQEAREAFKTTERDFYLENPFCPWCGQRMNFVSEPD